MSNLNIYRAKALRTLFIEVLKDSPECLKEHSDEVSNLMEKLEVDDVLIDELMDFIMVVISNCKKESVNCNSEHVKFWNFITDLFEASGEISELAEVNNVQQAQILIDFNTSRCNVIKNAIGKSAKFPEAIVIDNNDNIIDYIEAGLKINY